MGEGGKRKGERKRKERRRVSAPVAAVTAAGRPRARGNPRAAREVTCAGAIRGQWSRVSGAGWGGGRACRRSKRARVRVSVTDDF
jgi:hypothetical protein